MVPYHIVVNERSKRSTDIPGKTQPRSIFSFLYRGAWVFLGLGYFLSRNITNPIYYPLFLLNSLRSFIKSLKRIHHAFSSIYPNLSYYRTIKSI